MTRVAVTGGSGFLGWHLRVVAAARGDVDVLLLDRATCADEHRLAAAVDGVDRVVHLAGVNRGADELVHDGNVDAARTLASALTRCDRPPAVAFANSSQCGNGSVYGTAKGVAADLLREACDSVGSGLADVRLPNLFGEHGRPFYNSVVATFCHQLASGASPEVKDDRLLDLVHARAAAGALLDAPTGEVTAPRGRAATVSEVLTRLTGMSRTYARAEIPALHDDFDVDLFNTYRSAVPTSALPVLPEHSDDRGSLVEATKAHGSPGQCFFSTSHPGVTRGQHYHLRKVERFVVVQGEAVIALRRLFSGHVVQHRVDGRSPVAVDMPTMWVHSITNVGASPLLTLFWTNELFDPAAPDTYPEAV